jgi:hypothetical protein
MSRSVLLWIAAGVLIGGTYSFYKNADVPKGATILVGLLAALATAGAILWSI